VGFKEKGNNGKMNQLTVKTYELPAGKYFIGDVSNFLQDSVLKNISNGQNTYCSHHFVLTKPLCGLFTGSDDFIYDIDERLAIIHENMGDSSKFTGCGTFHTFDDVVTVCISDDILAVQSGDWTLTIDTTKCYTLPSDDEGYDSWS
jgi:hypothetical protein